MAVILGGNEQFPTFFLTSSQTFVPPLNGNVMIHVVGAGGSGSGSNTQATNGAGGAGGYCRKNSLAVTTSSSFTVVIGAGHVPVEVNQAGGNGGNTTVAGTGLSATLTANGGTGHDRTNTATDAPGGTASNGDVNYTGGAGGKSRGGGAVGLTGTGEQGFEGSAGSNGIHMGGDCDIIGDFWSSSLGQIQGGLPGAGCYGGGNAQGFKRADAAPLSGAGGVGISSGYNYPTGGNASIGGGGGGAYYGTGTWGPLGGRGGEGIVIFQYIP
jgi:collagen type III alpha